jgi:IS4 transposase
LPANIIAELYRKRWQVELFFKWIKQHLRIRSENAVRCQIWSAICAYLMVAIAKQRLKIEKTLNEILQIVSVSIFEQVPVEELLAKDAGITGQKVEETRLQNSFTFKD